MYLTLYCWYTHSVDCHLSARIIIFLSVHLSVWTLINENLWHMTSYCLILIFSLFQKEGNTCYKNQRYSVTAVVSVCPPVRLKINLWICCFIHTIWMFVRIRKDKIWRTTTLQWPPGSVIYHDALLCPRTNFRQIKL